MRGCAGRLPCRARSGRASAAPPRLRRRLAINFLFPGQRRRSLSPDGRAAHRRRFKILDFLEKSSSHQYWLGKSYILWARIFMARNELFQARYTLQNVLQHYKIQDDGIIDEVNDTLDEITDMEMAAKAQETRSVELDMEGKNE